MKYKEAFKWDRIKSELQEGIQQGVVAVKKGAIAVKKKTGELTEAGKRRYRILSLKSKEHQSISELGAKVYDLMRTKAKNPALDKTVKGVVARIKKIDSRIAALEKKSKESLKKVFKKVA
jgi:hypothetical protein